MRAVRVHHAAGLWLADDARLAASSLSCAHCARPRPRVIGSGAAAPRAIEKRWAAGRSRWREPSRSRDDLRNSSCSHSISCDHACGERALSGE